MKKRLINYLAVVAGVFVAHSALASYVAKTYNSTSHTIKNVVYKFSDNTVSYEESVKIGAGDTSGGVTVSGPMPQTLSQYTFKDHNGHPFTCKINGTGLTNDATTLVFTVTPGDLYTTGEKNLSVTDGTVTNNHVCNEQY